MNQDLWLKKEFLNSKSYLHPQIKPQRYENMLYYRKEEEFDLGKAQFQLKKAKGVVQAVILKELEGGKQKSKLSGKR